MIEGDGLKFMLLAGIVRTGSPVRKIPVLGNQFTPIVPGIGEPGTVKLAVVVIQQQLGISQFFLKDF